jgi:hypothetical protein
MVYIQGLCTVYNSAGLQSAVAMLELAGNQGHRQPQQYEHCVEPAISHDSRHVSLVQWTNLFAFRHKGHRFKSPGGFLWLTGILLLALSRYIGDPDVIDHQQGFVPNCH